METAKTQKHDRMVERWRKKSAGYARYKDCDDCIEARIFESMKKGGINFSGKTLLDVGCGTGVYTIRAAKEAGQVTGIDISKEMLEKLNEDADREGCVNIATVNLPWDTYDTEGRKWDIVMSTMTPAVQLPADYQKVYDSASEAVIFLGWAGRRELEILEDIVKKAGSLPKMFNNSPKLKAWLDSKGISYYSEIFDEVRTKTVEYSKIFDYCSDELESYELTVTEEEVNAMAEKFRTPDGNVTFRIFARLELVVYKKYD